MKIAALDLGTNSFLCLIAEVQDGRIKKIYSDQVEIVRLGQGVNENKKFHPDALVRARASLSNFKKMTRLLFGLSLMLAVVLPKLLWALAIKYWGVAASILVAFA